MARLRLMVSSDFGELSYLMKTETFQWDPICNVRSTISQSWFKGKYWICCQGEELGFFCRHSSIDGESDGWVRLKTLDILQPVAMMKLSKIQANVPGGSSSQENRVIPAWTKGVWAEGAQLSTHRSSFVNTLSMILIIRLKGPKKARYTQPRFRLGGLTVKRITV